MKPATAESPVPRKQCREARVNIGGFRKRLVKYRIKLWLRKGHRATVDEKREYQRVYRVCEAGASSARRSVR